MSESAHVPPAQARPLPRRKAVVAGMVGVGTALAAGVGRPSAAVADDVRPSTPAAVGDAVYVARWEPATAYAAGDQVISPTNDVVAAKVDHTSGPEYAPDASSWAVSPTFVTGLSVTGSGATGDGVTDDTAAFLAAVTDARGREVHVPPGTYVLDGLVLSGEVVLRLAEGAVLRHRTASANHMILFSGTRLLISGGTIDGNTAGQAGLRRHAIRAAMPSGTRIDVHDVSFVNTNASAVFGEKFGGELDVSRCRFTGMAEHDGVPGHWTCAVYVESGQAGAKGRVRFNHNVLRGTNTPAFAGGSPGGLFFAPTLDYANGIGNFSTLEAVGNHFWGIGQHCTTNDISPIHTYPAVDGARVIGNYFEQCGFCAISAKSAQNFVCQGNTVVNGMVSPMNVATEGAISYAPGYHSGSTARPRAVISGNIIDTPGGQTSTLRQDGICVLGIPTSLASDVVVSDNVITGAGVSIRVNLAVDVTVSGNTIDGSSGGSPNTQHGIRFSNTSGNVVVSGNKMTVRNGHGIRAEATVSAASFFVSDNVIRHPSPGSYGIVVRGARLATFSGNVIDSAGSAISIASDGVTNLGTFHWDLSNTILAGSSAVTWAQVTTATGQLRGTGSPVGLVTPGEAGTTYQQLNGTATGTLWVATGTTNRSWTQVMAQPASSAWTNRLLGASFDPVVASGAVDAAPGGVLAVAKVPVPAGGAVGTVVVHVVTPGSGLTGGRCLVGVYDAGGVLLATSGDQSTAWSSAGPKRIPLLAPTPVLAPGAEVYVAWFWNGATGPALAGANGLGLGNAGIVQASESRFATAGSGLTTALPASCPARSPASAATWVGLA